jgi:hypothetical protein
MELFVAPLGSAQAHLAGLVGAASQQVAAECPVLQVLPVPAWVERAL